MNVIYVVNYRIRIVFIKLSCAHISTAIVTRTRIRMIGEYSHHVTRLVENSVECIIVSEIIDLYPRQRQCCSG